MEPPPRPLVYGQPKPILIGLPAQAADLSKPKKGGAGAEKRNNYLGSGLPSVSSSVVCIVRNR